MITWRAESPETPPPTMQISVVLSLAVGSLEDRVQLEVAICSELSGGL